MQESSRGADPTARTYVYTCLCMQANRLKHVRTFLIGYRSGGTPDILWNLRARDWIAGRRRGSSACQCPGDLPALRVACRCSNSHSSCGRLPEAASLFCLSWRRIGPAMLIWNARSWPSDMKSNSSTTLTYGKGFVSTFIVC